MPASSWIAHVKSVYAAGKSGGLTYSQAMKKAAATYKKKAPAPKKRKGRKKKAQKK